MRNNNLPEDKIGPPVYETKIKIPKKVNTRKCLSMGLSKNNSKDEVAFNLVILQLSSKGKTYGEMEKKMMKEKRLKSVIEKSILNKKEQITGRFELDYRLKDKKEYLKQLFPSKRDSNLPLEVFNNWIGKKEKNHQKERDEALLEEIKNWKNYSLDEGVNSRSIESKDLLILIIRLQQKGKRRI